MSELSAAAPPVRLDGRPFEPLVFASLFVVAVVGAAALAGPALLGAGNELDTRASLLPPSAAHWFGTDNLGRDIFVRTVSGARNSLVVGLGTAILALVIGGAIGLVAGYYAVVDRIVMRVMDGFMAIPGIILAIALASVLGRGLLPIIIAIAVPEVPRTARLTRSVVLAIKELPFVAAAISVGSSTPKILARHILPNAVGALMVQATFICASAILAEAYLGFLGVGTPPDVPSWGNIIATGRQYFRLAPWIIGFPGLFLSLLILAINILGDSLRDRVDPRLMARRGS